LEKKKGLQKVCFEFKEIVKRENLFCVFRPWTDRVRDAIGCTWTETEKRHQGWIILIFSLKDSFKLFIIFYLNLALFLQAEPVSEYAASNPSKHFLVINIKNRFVSSWNVDEQ
jgi:hypothetical protein